MAATPSVALTRMFQAAHIPATDSEAPSTSTRSPRPTNGRRTANATNGTSMARRRPISRNGTPATTARPASTTAKQPYAQNASRGVETTASTKRTVAATLHSGGARCRRLVPEM